MAAKTVAPTSERRALKVDVAIIRTIIRGQAGSLEKALMEAVANSMDAGASRIDVTVTPTQVVIQDNGKGFAKREEVEKYFEVFGFEHQGLDREHGRFGVGRGQLFCYGVNHWRTHTFEMSLDVDNQGFDYDFKVGLKAVKGMTITIDLYKELSLRDSYSLEENFRQLVRYSVVPVSYNGKLISEAPMKAKWSQETDDAWFNLKREGALRIYSQGLLVTQTHSHGVGGVLVTKPGHPFELNMARNDIIKDKCEVWARVKKVLSAKARELGDRGMRQNTLTDDQRRTLAQDTLVEGSANDLWERPLFTLTNGKHVSLRQLTSREDWAEAPAGDRKADVLQQRQTLFVLSPDTMARFGVDTLDELKERLMDAFTRVEKAKGQDASMAEYYRDKIVPITTHASLAPFEHLVDLDFEKVKRNDLTSDEKAALIALRRIGATMGRLLSEQRRQSLGKNHPEARVPLRDISVMRSDTADGMTDGTRNIWINRKLLPKVHYGVPGFFELTTLIAHEYAHLSSSQGSHHHDHAFFETYHDLTRSSSLSRMAINGFALYLKHAKKANATLQTGMDLVFKGDIGLLFQDDGEAALEAQEAAYEAELQASLKAVVQAKADAAEEGKAPNPQAKRVKKVPATPATPQAPEAVPATPRRRRRVA
jgi:hypothetical protein